MNYCDKIHYRIYTTGLAEFDSMVDDLLRCLPQGEAVLRLVFLANRQIMTSMSYIEIS